MISLEFQGILCCIPFMSAVEARRDLEVEDYHDDIQYDKYHLKCFLSTKSGRTTWLVLEPRAGSGEEEVRLEGKP